MRSIATLAEGAVRWLRRSYRAGALVYALAAADRKPFERRGVLAITVAPVIAGLMANDAHAVRAGRLSGMGVVPVRALQVGLIGLFGDSLARARAADRAPGRSA